MWLVPVQRLGNPKGGIFTYPAPFDLEVVVTLYLRPQSSPIVAPYFPFDESISLDEHDSFSTVCFTSMGGGGRWGGDPAISGSVSRKYELPDWEWICQKMWHD